MTADRRAFLRGAAGAALLLAGSGAIAQSAPNSAPVIGVAQPGTAASPSGLVIVELANFFCDRCRQVNDHYPRLRRAAIAADMDLRFAPVTWQTQSPWPSRVYYATRDLYPEAEQLVRDMLFDGIHAEGMAFENLPQVLSHLERKQLPRRAVEFNKTFNLAQVADRANTDEILFSEVKAGRLIEMSGATEVPVFVWVQNAGIAKALSPANAREPIALVQLVQREITSPST